MAARVPAKLASEASARLKSLELLYDYTKFHIGIYITLTGSYLSAATLRVDGQLLLKLNLASAWVAVPAFMLAGLARGSNRQQHYPNDSQKQPGIPGEENRAVALGAVQGQNLDLH